MKFPCDLCLLLPVCKNKINSGPLSVFYYLAGDCELIKDYILEKGIPYNIQNQRENETKEFFKEKSIWD